MKKKYILMLVLSFLTIQFSEAQTSGSTTPLKIPNNNTRNIINRNKLPTSGQYGHILNNAYSSSSIPNQYGYILDSLYETEEGTTQTKNNNIQIKKIKNQPSFKIQVKRILAGLGVIRNREQRKKQAPFVPPTSTQLPIQSSAPKTTPSTINNNDNLQDTEKSLETIDVSGS